MDIPLSLKQRTMRANDSFIVFSKKNKINWACISDLPCACHYVIIFKNVFFNQNKGNQSIGPLGSHPQYLYYKSQLKTISTTSRATGRWHSVAMYSTPLNHIKRGRKAFSEKSQIVNILGFLGQQIKSKIVCRHFYNKREK